MRERETKIYIYIKSEREKEVRGSFRHLKQPFCVCVRERQRYIYRESVCVRERYKVFAPVEVAVWSVCVRESKCDRERQRYI